jgi:hypothetical protein
LRKTDLKSINQSTDSASKLANFEEKTSPHLNQPSSAGSSLGSMQKWPIVPTRFQEKNFGKKIAKHTLSSSCESIVSMTMQTTHKNEKRKASNCDVKRDTRRGAL